MPDAPMTEADLAEIEARCEAATPGPVDYEYDNDTGPGDEGFWQFYRLSIGGQVDEEADAAFIAHAYTDVPAIIAALRRSWAENADLKAALAKTVNLAKAAMLAGERDAGALAAMNAVCDHQTDRRGGKVPETEEWGIPMRYHPLTCGNNSSHTPLFPYWTGERVILMCRDCGYTQDNAGMFWQPAAPPVSPEAREDALTRLAEVEAGVV